MCLTATHSLCGVRDTACICLHIRVTPVCSYACDSNVLPVSNVFDHHPTSTENKTIWQHMLAWSIWLKYVWVRTWTKVNSLQLTVLATEGSEVTASRESSPRAMMPTDRYSSILQTSSPTHESGWPAFTCVTSNIDRHAVNARVTATYSRAWQKCETDNCLFRSFNSQVLKKCWRKALKKTVQTPFNHVLIADVA